MESGKILVTGVTGNVAGEMPPLLQKAGLPFIAAARNPEKAREQLGGSIEYIAFDFEAPETFRPALEQSDKVFLIRPPAISDIRRLVPFLTACKQAKVRHIVFLSLLGAEKMPFVPHRKIEACILKAGIPYTFLRASFFMQNLSTTHRDEIRNENMIYVPAGNGRTSFIDVRDIAEVAVRAFHDPQHLNQAYSLTGFEALTYNQVAEIFSSVLGRTITYVSPPPSQFRARLIERGVPKDMATVMVGIYVTARIGLAKKVTPDIERILGRKPISMHTFIEDYQSWWK
ncbi:SDR family oxidoreductase [Brevibacillus fluminis]|uniref:SDR family oxidoreductase n=1 Tax=Brevibacillus fluminis TaxID=511487 RepID=UPI003F8A3FBD